MKTLSLVIPVFNQVHFTKRCFPSIINGATKPHEFIIIDNHSKDETPDYLKKFKSESESKGWKIQIISNPKNVGVGAAFNQGISASKSDYILLGNNDTWFMPGWDEAMLNAAEKLHADMLGAYFNEDPFDLLKTPQKAKKFITRNKNKYSKEWMSILMCFPRATFEKVGVFDERYFVCFEDRDLKERIVRAGLKYYTTADCYIWHHSKGTRDAAALPSGYEAESLKKFIDKWGFDPRIEENKFIYRNKIKFRKFKRKLGFF